MQPNGTIHKVGPVATLAAGAMLLLFGPSAASGLSAAVREIVMDAVRESMTRAAVAKVAALAYREAADGLASGTYANDLEASQAVLDAVYRRGTMQGGWDRALRRIAVEVHRQVEYAAKSQNRQVSLKDYQAAFLAVADGLEQVR